MGLRKIFLDWDRELAKAAAGRLLKDAKHSEFIDLSHILVVVSTAHSIKNLGLRLTETADEEGSALLPPRIVTPQYFLSNNTGKKTPNDTQRILCYIESIKKTPCLSFLFPNTSEEDKNFLWYMDKAEHISGLADSLASVGLTIEDFLSVHQKILGDEINRFDELSHIEHAYFQLLAKAGFEDPNKVKIESALNPKLPSEISKVIFIAVTDPTPIICETINILSSHTELEIWISAPPELDRAFDIFGRPIHNYWKEKDINIADFKNRIFLSDSPNTLSIDFTNLIAEKIPLNTKTLDIEDISIIMPDSSLEPPIRHSFLRHDIETYNPSGKKLHECLPYSLFIILMDFILHQNYISFSALIKNADFLAYAETKIEGLDYAKLFSLNDKIQNDYMPNSFEYLSGIVILHKEALHPYSEVLSIAKHFLKTANNNIFSAFSIMEEIYNSIFSCSEIKPCDYFSEAVKAIANTVSEVKDIACIYTNIQSSDISLLLLKSLRDITLFPSQKNGTLPLRGWLELQWEDKRLLTFIVGMNEGIVPSTTANDIFLPDSIKKKIGLPCDDSRFARDAYILESALHCKNGNKINFVVMKTNQKGEYLKPSRLLLQILNQDSFYERLNYLFRQDSISFEHGTIGQSDYPVKYSVPLERLRDNKLRVTDFKSYLECPFRFYLKRVLGYENESDDAKTDIDEARFGSICHDILKELGEVLNNKNSKGLDTMLEVRLQQAKSAFSPSIPVEFSFYSLEQRLKKALSLMIEDRANGQWKVLATEKPFSLTLDSEKLTQWFGKEINKEIMFTLKGRIDRIDIGADGKSLRIIDYKTGNVPESPEKEHYKAISAKTDESLLKDYSVFELNGKKHRWTDLQLPLYAVILGEMEEYKNFTITDCSYFVIPKAVTDTRITAWPNIGAEEISAARKCAAGIIIDIANHTFWPPSEKVKYDDFEKLLYDSSYNDYIRFKI